MLNLTRIPTETTHNDLDRFLCARPILPVFFYSPHAINYFAYSEKEIYIAGFENEQALIVFNTKNNDVRFLFHDPSEGFSRVVFERFKPAYLAVNELISPPNKGEYLTVDELEIDFSTIANLKDAGVRKHYKQCTRKHPQVKFESWDKKYIEKAKIFLEEWKNTRSDEKNKHAKIENDLHFLDIYGCDSSVLGGVVLENERIIALSLGTPSLVNGKMTAIINKVLRGYVELGIFTYVERAKLMLHLGYARGYTGAINNEFKKNFFKNGFVHKTFCYKIMKDEQYVLINEERYLRRFF